MTKQTKNILINFLKFAIAFLSFFYIYLKLKEYNEQEINFNFSETYHLLILGIVVFMMLVNWSIEAIKWKYLVKDFEKITFLTSIKAVFSGISFAIFTPNRVGELVGRVFVLKKENRTKGIFATAVGSFSQMMITVNLGVIFGIVFLFLYGSKIQNISNETLLFIKIFSVIILGFGLYIFFNLKILVSLFNKFNFSENLIEAINIFSSYKKMKMLKLLIISLLRYVVFLSQYYLLLIIFNVDISFFEASIGIILTYFISSAIPTFTFAEIGIRGTIAIFFLGMFSENTIGIISATALLWIINLAVPAIIGSFIFYRTKI